jgi:lysozyme
MNTEKLLQFLNKNPCLSQEWKDELINVILNSSAIGTPFPTPTLDEYIKYIQQFEGMRTTVYIDTTGNPTIGMGTNLNNDLAKQNIQYMGHDINEILVGNAAITVEDAYNLAEIDIKYILKVMPKVVGIQDFDSLPFPLKLILVDMAYNLGINGLQKFRKMIAAVNGKDYENVIVEMQDSKWFNQVGNRSKHHVEVIERLLLC